MITSRRYLEPQVAVVPLKADDLQIRIELGKVHSGPFMRAKVIRPLGTGCVAMTVYACESDVPLMDLSFLRVHGQPCEVGPWEPKDRDEGIAGPILRPCFQLAPGRHGFDVELTHAMPKVIERTITTRSA
ncbi:hypothetical protein FV219_06610 [Methylobacterium sp. WL122]|nr:hypothetical protein FV219_06610 [Methylobacterium sp. WL122]